MLYFYQSNRLEDLASLFAKIHKLQPPHPLLAENIVVQSQGMQRYLTNYLARENGIAANLQFNLPASMAWQLICRLIPDVPPLNPFSSEVMRWRLLNLFQSKHFQTAPEYQTVYRALEGYLNSGPSSAYYLAGQLADVFDQYLVYRPKWINAWQQGKTIGLGNDEVWQAALWHYLDNGTKPNLHRVALWQQLLNTLDKDNLPQRYYVFGIAAMAPMYLQLLQALSEHCDVHIFALNPSSTYWGNVVEPVQILQQDHHNGLDQVGHPLLASLGKQGRDFFDALTDIPKHEIAVFDDTPLPTRHTLLHRLQHDIQTLTMPAESPHGSAAHLLHDGSIHIVSAHSPLRELQILKNHLLETLAANPDWQPHDIAVLTPDIEPYSPFINAVFGQSQAGAQALPYSISDIKASRQSPLLQVLAQILTLLESRFEVSLLLPLLENDLIQQRFKLSRDDTALLHQTIAALNIHWGADQAMRGSGDQLFTWQQGLERLILGFMLPENNHALWQGISAWHGSLNQVEVFGRFIALVRLLADTARQWQHPAPVAQWTERIRTLMEALTAPSGSQHAWQTLLQLLARWQEEAALGGFQADLPQHTAIRHINRFLNNKSHSGFLRSGITFCSMVPMRSLPFKIICLLGLNDGAFPRNTKAATFDLIARHPQKGDRARRNDDRYLFLEAIMSARNILYLSYVGRDIRNNQELAPSPLLNELIDTVAAMCNSGQYSSSNLHKNWINQHPLQAFSRSYFITDGQANQLTSTRHDYAQALNTPTPPKTPFLNDIPATGSSSNAIYQHEFIQFWKNPVRHWLLHTLNWREPRYPDEQHAEEPFEPTQTSVINAAYTAARRGNENFTHTQNRLQAQSLLPAGELGILWHHRFQTAVESLNQTLLASPKLPPLPYTLNVGSHTFTGSLNRLYQHGQIYFLNKPLTMPKRIAALLEHLIFCAVNPSNLPDCQTHLLLLQQPETLQNIQQQQAMNLLEQWLDCYQIGQNHPLPFFARTSLEAAEKLAKSNKNGRKEAEQAAAQAYYGNRHQSGQQTYTEVALVFGNDETPPIATDLFWHIVENLLTPLLISSQQHAP